METDRRARIYHRWQFRLAAGGWVLSACYLLALIVTGATVGLRDTLAGMTSRWWLQLTLALIVLGGAYCVITLPLQWMSGFWLPRRFGLLHQPLSRWLWDVTKGALVGGGLGLLAALTVYGLLRATPRWWLWGAGIFLAG